MSSAQATIAEYQPVADAAGFRGHMGRISRQSAVFFAGTLFSVASAYFFKIYLARVLGAEGLGTYTLGMTLVGFLGVFNALGLPQAAVRFVAVYTATGKHNHLHAFLGGSVTLLLASNLLLGGVLLLVGPWIAAHFYHTPELSRYLPLFAVIMLLGCMTTFLGQVLAGFKDVAKRTIIANFVGNPVVMILAIVLIAAGRGLRGYLVAQVGSAIVVLALLVVSIWRIAPRRTQTLERVSAEVKTAVLSFSAAALGVGVLEFLLAQADKVFIGFWLNARQVGIYAVATAIVSFIPIALQSVNQIFSPMIADLYSRSEGEMLGRLFQTLTKWILGLSLPLATCVVVFAHSLMRIFGPEFESGWPILVIGALGQLVNCGVGSVGYLLLMSGHQYRLVKVQAAMAAVMITINLALIPWLGILGAAIAAAVTNVVSNLWYLREVRRALGITPYNRSYLQMLAPLGAMVMAILLVKPQIMAVRPFWLAFLLALAAAYAIFLCVMLALGMNQDDRLIVSSVWAKLRGTVVLAEAAS
jgi:O-antigen/teichoic acid export membrane protein